MSVGSLVTQVWPSVSLFHLKYGVYNSLCVQVLSTFMYQFLIEKMCLGVVPLHSVEF